ITVPSSPTIAHTTADTNTIVVSAIRILNLPTVTLADNGATTCTVNNGTVLSLAVQGITNSPTAAAATVNIKSSSDSGTNAAGGTLAALAAPAAVTAATSTLAVGAKATWTLTLNPNAGGSLRAGSTLTATFSAPAGFTIPASPTIALTPAATNCVVGSAVGNGNVLTVTLADN